MIKSTVIDTIVRDGQKYISISSLIQWLKDYEKNISELGIPELKASLEDIKLGIQVVRECFEEDNEN